MFGDRNLVLTPLKKPPKKQKVEEWVILKNKFEQKLQSEKQIKLDLKIKNKTTEPVVTVEKIKGQTSQVAKKKYKKGPNFKRSKPKSSNLDETEKPDCTSAHISPPSKGNCSNTDEKTANINLSPTSAVDVTASNELDAYNSCLKKTFTAIKMPEMHASTPARRVSFDDQLPPQVTPIPRRRSSSKSKESSRSPELVKSPDDKLKNEDSDEDTIPPTPSPPMASHSQLSFSLNRPYSFLARRSSSGIDTNLRRTLLSSQMRNQFVSPNSTANLNISHIDGPTPKNSFGFKINSQCVQDAKALHEYQYITVLSLELHVRTRADYRPDPECDPICAVFYSIFHDVPAAKGERHVTGVICVDPQSAKRVHKFTNVSSSTLNDSASGSEYANKLLLQNTGVPSLKTTYVSNEIEIMEKIVELTNEWNPEILIGYEIQMLSWGFLIKRANHLSIDLQKRLSRIQGGNEQQTFKNNKEDDITFSDIVIPGRIVLCLWQILRYELTLNIYTFENVVYHVLHKRVPLYSLKNLTFWFDHKLCKTKWKTLEYYVIRAKGNLQILEQLDLIGQTSEFARVFGIEFYHVLSRGSQYRVESMMLRIAKPMNYIPVSPSVHQRARMRAPECIPLTMEPQSKFYTDPVVVVDFQSLYPSIMMAYNYCYSTCLGRIENLEKIHEGSFEFGCTSLDLPPKVLDNLKNHVSICPNGVCFVKENIKKGILPRMVGDILKTRLMVKKSMKEYKDDNTLQRLLHARQLSLKLIANVTFGYTSANFSGRMPCMEIGDSIVRKARETLERAIELVHSNPKWGAEVVYGDTDSMFILLKGRTKDEAFVIGQAIADAVTQDNPKPVKLKFEKVYLPCVLQTKKRYVGYMYETPDQKEPVYDAKGIETVRRDSCAAVSKILEKSIKILFSTHDVSRVKSYVQKQWTKLLEGKVSVQDCIFAKEYRGMSGYKPGACVPALDIAKRRLTKDRRSEPRVGERVPYVIVYGTPGLPLIQLVREPHELLTDPNLRINATYYITKQIIPPLMRIFMLMGVDVLTWYNELPRTVRSAPQGMIGDNDGADKPKKGTITQFFHSLNCPICDEITQSGMCNQCKNDLQRRAVLLNSRVRKAEKNYFELYSVCVSCMGCENAEAPCRSLDCPIMFRMNRAARDMSQITSINQLKKKYLDF